MWAGTQAVLSFTLNQAGAAHLICLLVAGGDWSGSGTYAQPASLTVGVAEIASRSPSQIGTLLVVAVGSSCRWSKLSKD